MHFSYIYYQGIKPHHLLIININKRKDSFKRTEYVFDALYEKHKYPRVLFKRHSSAAYSAIRKVPVELSKRKKNQSSFFAFSIDYDYIRSVFTFLQNFFVIIEYNSCIILHEKRTDFNSENSKNSTFSSVILYT